MVSEESMMLSSTPLIRELVTLLRFLDHPLDDLSLLAFLSETSEGFPSPLRLRELRKSWSL